MSVSTKVFQVDSLPNHSNNEEGTGGDLLGLLLCSEWRPVSLLVHLELFDIWCVLKSATLGYSNYKIRILQRGDGVAWPEGRVGVICWLDVGPRIREQFSSAIKNR